MEGRETKDRRGQEQKGEGRNGSDEKRETGRRDNGKEGRDGKGRGGEISPQRSFLKSASVFLRSRRRIRDSAKPVAGMGGGGKQLGIIVHDSGRASVTR